MHTFPIKPEVAFLSLGLLFGLIFLLLTPPFQMPDEYAHFERIYAISQGRLIPKTPPKGEPITYIGVGAKVIEGRATGGGDYSPVSFLELYEKSSFLPYQPQERTSFEQILSGFDIPLTPETLSFRTHNAAVYSPVAYLPQSAVVAVMSKFNTSALSMMYGARLINLIVWLLLCTLAIRLLVTGKWVLVFIALSPMAVYEGAALSADGLTMGVCFVFMALVLRNVAGDLRQLGWREFLLFPLLLLIIAMCKFFYVGLGLLLLLIAPRQCGTRLRYALLLFLCLLIPLGATFLWSSQVRDCYTFSPEAAGKDQIDFILSSPVQYGTILGKALLTQSRIWARHFAGVFGWLDTPLPFWLAALYLLTLPLAGLTIARLPFAYSQYYSKKQRIYSLAVGMIVLLLVMSSLYIANSSYASELIGGMQGRYLLPIAPLVFISFPLTLDRLTRRCTPVIIWLCLGVITATLSYSTVLIFSRYYL